MDFRGVMVMSTRITIFLVHPVDTLLHRDFIMKHPTGSAYLGHAGRGVDVQVHLLGQLQHSNVVVVGGRSTVVLMRED